VRVACVFGGLALGAVGADFTPVRTPELANALVERIEFASVRASISMPQPEDDA